MNIKNVTLYMGQTEQNRGISAEKSNSIFVGNREQQDPILLKKQQARQKAMKIVGDTFASDRKLDEEQDRRREKVKELLQQLHEIEGYMKTEKELPEDEMTPEMKEAQNEAIREYGKQCQSLKNEIKAELITIEATKVERLKSSPMVKAQEAAETVLEAAGEEIIDMLLQEAKEHMEEEQEAREEQAEKIAEKREEEEERLEKMEENQQEAEELAEQLKYSTQEEVKKEIEEMLNKLKLLEEDLKGAAVDETL